MAKKNHVVTFSPSDAPKPGKTMSGLISLKAPFPFTLKPAASVFIDFGYKCNTPLVVMGTSLYPLTSVFGTNVQLKVQVHNPSLTDDFVADVGTTVLYAHPLVPVEYDLE